jgi:hypothetical protein
MMMMIMDSINSIMIVMYSIISSSSIEGLVWNRYHGFHVEAGIYTMTVDRWWDSLCRFHPLAR